MKKIMLTAAMMAMTMGTFAQTQVTEQDGFQSTTGSFAAYLDYDTFKLIDIMKMADNLTNGKYDNDATYHELELTLSCINFRNHNAVLNLYQQFLAIIPDYMQQADDKITYSGVEGDF